MFKKAAIIPTGDEIRSGIVTDIDSPEVMGILLKQYPACEVCRLSPVLDVENTIVETVERLSDEGYDLIVLIGGSGGGHRHNATLSCDYTHSALERCLTDAVSTQIYGKNGHMWCNLVCGYKKECLVINLPGPFREASAAMKSFVSCAAEDPTGLKRINSEMARAVAAQYPVK